jgi:hypothetical protein
MGMEKEFIIQRAITNNDSNGNPRRVYIVYNMEGRILETFNEGYLGSRAVPQDILDASILLPDLVVIPKEYKRLVKITKTL